MMMSKPKPETKSSVSATVSKPPETASDAVADLERRLAMIGGAEAPQQAPPSDAGSNGKNALLARIMAAQERAKQAQPKSSPSNTSAFAPSAFGTTAPVMSAPPATTTTQSNLPSSMFDPMAAPSAADPPPPAFDALEHSLVPPPVTNDPSSSASAPSFEDLLSGTAPPVAAPPAAAVDVTPPPQTSPHPQQFSEEFAGLEGLSEQEKAEIMEEQRKIMAEIEKNQKGSAASALTSRADAFDQRSNAAVARIIGGGQPSLSNHSVPAFALPPEERIITPGPNHEVDPNDPEAAQMEADRKMAEQLQREEYSAADREERRAAQRSQRRATQRAAAAAEASNNNQDQSWLGWLGLSSTPAPAAARAGTSPRQNTRHTGEETINFSDSNNEREQLVSRSGGGGGGGAPRVAQQKPLFACVADSITTAAESITGLTLTEDHGGNVHGVDSSSLLSVSNPSRGTGYEQYRD